VVHIQKDTQRCEKTYLVKTVKETRLTNCVVCKELLIFFTYLFHE